MHNFAANMSSTYQVDTEYIRIFRLVLVRWCILRVFTYVILAFGRLLIVFWLAPVDVHFNELFQTDATITIFVILGDRPLNPFPIWKNMETKSLHSFPSLSLVLRPASRHFSIKMDYLKIVL